MYKGRLSDLSSYVSEKIPVAALTDQTYIGVDNMFSNRGGVKPSEYVPEAGLVTKFEQGDILLGNIRPYFKKIWLAEFDGGCSPDVLVIRPKHGVSSKFLYAYLSTDGFFDYDMKGAKGSKMPRGDKDHIMRYEITIPDAQEKIGSFIININEKITNNDAICADLEDMAKLLYDYWFVQFDFPNENGKPYKSSGGKMVWNEELKREIPDGWEVIRLGDYITADRGISYNSTTLEGNGVPMMNLASFNVDSTYKASGLKTYSGAYGEDQVLRPYDLVMCNTQQTAIDPAKDIIGKTLLVPDIFDGDIVSSHHVTTIHVTGNAFKYYLHAESKTTWFHKYVAGFASGTNILGLDFNGVLNYKMPIPPKEIMSKFANISHSSEARKNEVIRENADLVGLRDFLLPMLMNGQVKVKGA